MKSKRILSMVIDIALIVLFETLFFNLIGKKIFESTYMSVGVAYFIGITILAFIQSRWAGATIGKRIMKLKIASDDEKDMTFLKYWARFLILYVLIVFSAGILLIVNVLMIIIRKDQKTIQDIIIHTHIEKIEVTS